MATKATTIVLQIIRFNNCNQCIREVLKELKEFDGVVLLKMNPVKGKFTISTVEHPEVIRAALQRKFPKKTVILLINCQDFNFQEAASRVMMMLPQADRIRNMKWTPDGLRIQFYEIRPSVVENVHTENVRFKYAPSAPPIPTTQGYAYGSPFEFHGYSAVTEDERPHSCCTCTIL